MKMPDAFKQIVGQLPQQAQSQQGPSPKLSSYAKTWVGEYKTQLNPVEEIEFQAWSSAHPEFVRGELGQYADYDIRGFWKAMRNNDPRAVRSVNPEDHRLHAPDIWKTPYHRSFSNESMYARPNAPHWVGNKLVDESGKVVFDETKK